MLTCRCILNTNIYIYVPGSNPVTNVIPSLASHFLSPFLLRLLYFKNLHNLPVQFTGLSTERQSFCARILSKKQLPPAHTCLMGVDTGLTSSTSSQWKPSPAYPSGQGPHSTPVAVSMHISSRKQTPGAHFGFTTSVPPKPLKHKRKIIIFIAVCRLLTIKK